MNNLRAQNKLKAELAWLEARSRTQLCSQRRAEIQADLAALKVVIAARRKSENLRA
jgi:hypothetical protein